MDHNNEDDVRNVDNEAADVVTNCLRNPLVLRTILEHFSSKELRQLSFVNKLWKSEARSVMRKRAQFTACVKSHSFGGIHPQKELDDFISDLKEMNPVPFSGISIHVYFSPYLAPFPIAAVDLFEGVVLGQPSLKTVSLILCKSWLDSMNSPGFLLVKKILQDCSGVLEELELTIDHGREDFMQEVVPDFTFPRLKMLKLRDDFVSDGVAYQNYMKAMLSRAPNLKVLLSAFSVNVMLSVLEGSSIMPVYERSEAPFEDISENALSAIKLEKITLEYSSPEFNFERFVRISPMLLQQCCTTTLHTMSLDALLAIPLMTYGIRLENVKNLYMEINYGRLQRIDWRILGIVQNFNFSRIFPSLNKAHIFCDNSVPQFSSDHMNIIFEQANAVLGEPTLDRAAGLKALVLQWNRSRASPTVAMQFFANMFPNIKTLKVITPDNLVLAPQETSWFDSIWQNWQDLKELEVRGHLVPTARNLDSVFLGIFPEEVAELRLQDDEYLTRVNIVPVMPAVTCLKELITLSLHHEDYRYDLIGGDATFIFSTVTVLLAFARQPALAVTLKISAHEAPPTMAHLNPYVAVTSHIL